MVVGYADRRLLVLILQAVDSLKCQFIAVETHLEHVHLLLQAKPILAPYQIMHKIKCATAHALRKEFTRLLKLPSLWTRSYFCGTAGKVSGITIKRYLEQQKTR